MKGIQSGIGLKTSEVGGKASNLSALERLGVFTSTWAVIPQQCLLDQLELTSDNTNPLRVPDQIIEDLKQYFGGDYSKKTYAVRSSAIDEDGSSFSFAGQFESFLHVNFNDLEKNIINVWESAVSDRVKEYRQQNNLELQQGIGVIIQEMVEPEVSGVAFGLDPISGDAKTKVISSVFGLGEGLVSGELDADTYHVNPSGVQMELAQKEFKFKRAVSSGIHKVALTTEERDASSLATGQLHEIVDILDKLEKHLGAPQDIEFAFQNGRLYVLQTRPITATGKSHQGQYTLWDNSNIVESYPGITTPLTFTFILKMYDQVYRQLVSLMGVSSGEIDKHKGVFAETLGLVRGRVYYNLLNWYKMLAMVPGYSLNAGFMENMMGVKEKFELQEDYKMSKGKAWFRILLMVFRMIRLQISLPKERKRFMAYLETILKRYKSLDLQSATSTEIIGHYKSFENDLLLEWKAPMINDFFAMIWFGLLQKQTAKYIPDIPNLHNDLLCGSEDIISVEPIHMTMAISTMVEENKEAKELFIKASPEDIYAQLQGTNHPDIKKAIDSYIERFGERCVGELKLETTSYVQDPVLFVRIVKSYVVNKVRLASGNSDLEKSLRSIAEANVAASFRNRPFKHKLFKFILKKTREHVSARENLRYERTRAFGMVRLLFSELGRKWALEGRTSNDRDIFYAELDEVLQSNISKDIIEKRKRVFLGYEDIPIPEERFFTYGNDFSDAYIYSKDKLVDIHGDLKGIGCCPGRVQAKVRVVRDPHEVESLNGDILITTSTDPGWVTLFPSASAIIVERGSLLSHSAIVSREMGIPCIVGVTGLLRKVKTGDEVIMDGSTGIIQLIE